MTAWIGEYYEAHARLSGMLRRCVGWELCTSSSGIGNSLYKLPEDLQKCDKVVLPLSHTKLLVQSDI